MYKVLSAIITDRLYRLTERYGLLDSSQEGFYRLHSTQRQVQNLQWTLHWAIRARMLQNDGSCSSVATWTLKMRNSVDHEAL